MIMKGISSSIISAFVLEWPETILRQNGCVHDSLLRWSQNASKLHDNNWEQIDHRRTTEWHIRSKVIGHYPYPPNEAIVYMKVNGWLWSSATRIHQKLSFKQLQEQWRLAASYFGDANLVLILCLLIISELMNNSCLHKVLYMVLMAGNFLNAVRTGSTTAYSWLTWIASTTSFMRGLGISLNRRIRHTISGIEAVTYCKI